MTNVGGGRPERQVVARGKFHNVCFAVRADGTEPARAFLEALRRGIWEPDPDAEEIPCDEQIRDCDWFFAAIRHWAKTGEPQYTRAVNDLEDGVWEFKHGAKRLSFYDTDGQGGYTAKLRIQDSEDAIPGDFWDIPYFDREIRLGHAFPKVSQMTTPFDIDETLQVREEDLEHDRPAGEELHRGD